MERKKSLKILHSIISKCRVKRRSKELILDPEMGSGGQWFVDVPACFNDALDIKFNCGVANPGWTQAGSFSFKAQDTFYDSPEGRNLSWIEGLNIINFTIIIQSEKHFAFTGKFSSGSRKDCKDSVEELGSIAQSSINSTTDYLVIGAEGSSNWAEGSHGRKIEKALIQKIEKGKPSIISEADWINAILAI